MHAQDLMTFASTAVSLRQAWRVCLLLFCMMFALPVIAEPGRFNVAEASAWQDADGWFVDARCDITLSSGAREALENGVPLVFELQVQLVRTHDWLWDTVLVEIKPVRQLQYHALSDSFIVREPDSGAHGIYGTLGDALAALGLYEGILLSDKPLADGEYKLRLRGSHDIESLPTPVRLLAYVSSEWDMYSEWYTWTLNR